MDSICAEKLFLYNPGRKTPFENILNFNIESELECGQCQKKSVTKTEYRDLSLTFQTQPKQPLTIDSLINDYFRPMDVDYNCFCGFSRAKLSTSMHSPPKILLLHLSRFEHLRDLVKKRNDYVEFSQSLNLGKWLFTLVGMVVHLGADLEQGHFIYYERTSEKLWTKYDDAFVAEDQSHSNRSKSVYILIYERR
jgi:uncharacterized UBP type Zn finger protein